MKIHGNYTEILWIKLVALYIMYCILYFVQTSINNKWIDLVTF